MVITTINYSTSRTLSSFSPHYESSITLKSNITQNYFQDILICRSVYGNCILCMWGCHTTKSPQQQPTRRTVKAKIQNRSLVQNNANEPFFSSLDKWNQMTVLPQDVLENIDKLTVQNCADSPFWGSALSQFIAHTHNLYIRVC